MLKCVSIQFRQKLINKKPFFRLFSGNNQQKSEFETKKIAVENSQEKYEGLTLFRKTRHKSIKFPIDGFKIINKGQFDNAD